MFRQILQNSQENTCLVFNEAADLQSLTLSKTEIPAQMFSGEFWEISHNTIFKEPKKLSISAKNAIVDVRPGSKYASVGSD